MLRCESALRRLRSGSMKFTMLIVVLAFKSLAPQDGLR
jgi:hypothetical protein